MENLTAESGVTIPEALEQARLPDGDELATLATLLGRDIVRESQHRGAIYSTVADGIITISETGQIEVDVSKPAKTTLELPAEVYFPMQHSTALVAAARDGKRQLMARLYDGSEKGGKVYETSAIIGGATPFAAAGVPDGVGNRETLAKVPSWPIAISYFEQGQENKDVVPSYELTFRIFANGVSSGLVIDYGEFAVRGELTDLTYFAATECVPDPAGKRTAPGKASREGSSPEAGSKSP